MNALAASLVRASPVVVHAEADASRWNAYVADHPEATAYHDWEWRGVIERAFGHETRYLVAKTAGGTAGVLPLVIFRSRVFGRFAVSMPFLNYGGVLASSREAEAALLDAAVREAHRADASYLELRHTRQVFPHLQAKRHKVAMVVDLQPSAGQQWQAVDRKVRNQVRKAEKSGLRVLQGHAELAEGFYQVFAHNMRDLGTPVYGRRWFREIVSMFPDSTRLFAVMAGERPVAAALVLWHRSSIEVPWASSLRAYNPQCPNVLLYWEMLRFACERGLARFDLGRSTPGEGTFQFKRQWGAEPRELVWEYWTADGGPLPELNPKNPRFARAIALWRRLPLPLANTLGPHIVRSIP
jgi:serine/alanine adding enzyme